MKRILCLMTAAALLLGMAACGRTEAPQPTPEAVAEVAPTPEVTPVPIPEPTAEPEVLPGTEPVLSPGAAEDSCLSALFVTGGDGAVYTGIARAEDITDLHDLLPEDIGYIAGIIPTDGGFCVSSKEYFYSLDPSALYYCPAEGEPSVLSAELSPSGVFCLAGDTVFFEGYGDGSLWSVPLTGGEPAAVYPDGVQLLAAADGFIYYARNDGVYRNDSTMTAEVKIISSNAGYLTAGPEGLCDLTYSDGGQTALLELRDLDGRLRGRYTLEELTDSVACFDGKVYVPQLAAESILVFPMDGAGEPVRIGLPQAEAYCQIRHVTENTVYYATVIDDQPRLCRVGTDGSDPQAIGDEFIF